MTLISYTSNYGMPILMGDLLITSDEQGEAPQIPVFLDSVDDALPVGQKSFPHGLKQKIYVIKDKIAVGLAGNVYQMTMFLQDIKNHFNHYVPNLENVQNFMSNYDEESVSDCSVVVLVAEKSEDGLHNYVTAHGKWEQYKDELLEGGLITGTGSASFFEKLRNLSPLEKVIDGHRGFNINLISLFMAEERYTMDSIVESWGAGFEVIEYTGEKFRKLDDFTYVICHSNYDKDNLTLTNTPFLVMHYTYHGDILTINTYLDTEFKRYGVLPLDMKKDEVVSGMIPEYNGFESKQVVCVFVIEKPEGGFYFTSILTHSKSDEYTIKVSFQPPAPAYLEVHIDEAITEKILEEYQTSINA